MPTGLQKYSDFWSHALLPGYDVKHGSQPNLGYYASAIIGTASSAVVGVPVAASRRDAGPTATARTAASATAGV